MTDMRRTQGNPDAPMLECVNPVKNKWHLRWDAHTDEDGTASYMELELDHLPTDEEIQDIIIAWINKRTDETILSGFIYEGDMVWLSQENQFNYKAAYDLAVQTSGATLPVTFKLGTDKQPHFRQFTDIDTLADFYTKLLAHVQRTLEEGWAAKQNIDMAPYHID